MKSLRHDKKKVDVKGINTEEGGLKQIIEDFLFNPVKF